MRTLLLTLAVLVGFYGNIATIVMSGKNYKNNCPAQQTAWTGYCTAPMVCPAWECVADAVFVALPECPSGHGNKCK